MRLITLNLPEPTIRQLDDIVRRGYHANRAEAIRAAIRDLIQLDKKRSQKKEVKECNIKLRF